MRNAQWQIKLNFWSKITFKLETSHIFVITRAQYRKYDSNIILWTECTFLFGSSAMFPLIFCGLYAQKFWCVRTFLEWVIFVQLPMKKFQPSNTIISRLIKKVCLFNKLFYRLSWLCYWQARSQKLAMGRLSRGVLGRSPQRSKILYFFGINNLILGLFW